MAGMMTEKTQLRLGILPLTDCAPLVIAKERGFFAEMGLDVEISREASWASIRDKVAVGTLDGAHMLAPLPLAMSAGVSPVRVPMVVGMALNWGGNTITLSNTVWERLGEITPEQMLSAAHLRPIIEADRAAGRGALTFASVYPVSAHTYQLRLWLQAGGIDPDRDVRLVVVPPPQMVASLSSGGIAGFCVGEPWGSLAVRMGLGRVALTSGDICAGRVEKVFAVTRAWAESHPQTHLVLLQALIAAARWCDEHRAETAEILCQPQVLNAPYDVVAAALLGEGGLPLDHIQFHRNGVNCPQRAQALWYLERMAECGQIGANLDHDAIADSVFRPDLYGVAAERLGADA